MVTQRQRIMISDMPFLITPLEDEKFNEKDVIYAVLCLQDNGDAYIIDLGQSSEKGGPPFAEERRRECWLKYANGRQLLVGVHRPASDFNMAQDRIAMIDTIRREFSPPCELEFSDRA